MSKKFTSVLCMLFMFMLGTTSLSAQVGALGFNSADSTHASLTNAYIVPGYDSGTVEFWVYVPTSEPGQHFFISQGQPGFAFYMGYDGDESNHILIGDLSGARNVSLPIAQWTHIALTFTEGTVGNASLYVNGVKVDSIIDNSYFTTFPSSGTQTQLATNIDSTVFFSGVMDQVRVWKTQRTADQIKKGMYSPVDASSPDLLAYYQMNEGSGTIAASSAITTGYDFTLLGNPGHQPNWTTAPTVGGNNALTFNAATSSKLAALGSPAYDLTTGTIEAYVRPGTVDGAILAISDGTNTHVSVHLDNVSATNKIGLSNSVNGLATVDYPAGFSSGTTWYHLAFVTAHSTAESKDTTGTYVNGAYVGKIDQGYALSPGGKDSLPVTIGANGSGGELWQGGIDEVRIWNVARSQTEIQTDMGNTLSGGESGLLSIWSFDQGIP